MNSQNLGNTHTAMIQSFATKSLNKMVFEKLFGSIDNNCLTNGMIPFWVHEKFKRFVPFWIT